MTSVVDSFPQGLLSDLTGMGRYGAKLTFMQLLLCFWPSGLCKNSVKEMVVFPFLHAGKRKDDFKEVK